MEMTYRDHNQAVGVECHISMKLILSNGTAETKANKGKEQVSN
jgi:hypothetical protein